MSHVVASRGVHRLSPGVLLLAALLLSACTLDPHRAPEETPPPRLDSATVASNNAEIHLDLVRDMIAKGQDYAALAHLQDLKQHGTKDPQIDLLEADCRRHLGQRTEADALYRKLLAGPLAGQAYHGLGLLYVRSNLTFAMASLKRAAQLVPTDPDVRNDYGRALMEAGRYSEAMPELSTAAELAPGATKSRRNLIVLMMLMRNETAVSQLSQAAGIDATELQKLRLTAQNIRAAQTAKPATAG